MLVLGTLYGVGVGPGDPKLLTLLAIETIKKCPCIAVPQTGNTGSMAQDIVKDYILGKELLPCYMPMINRKEEMAKAHQKVIDTLCGYLQEKDVCFITLGDPSIYATYMYVHQAVMDRGFKVKMVPGVPSFCAAAAVLNKALCLGEEALTIIPGTFSGLDTLLDGPGTKVIMKTGRHMEKLVERLENKAMLNRTSCVENCTMEGEQVYRGRDIACAGGYFSTVVVKE